jgi:hypothetical protein
MCSDILENEDITMKIVFKNLKMLVSDRVVNVRVSLALLMSEVFIHKSIYNYFLYFILEFAWVLKHEGCNKLAFHLKSDANKNVYSLFADCKDISEKLYSDEELGESNSLFLNKMFILKDEFGITRNLPVNSRPCSRSLNHRKFVNSIN